METVETVKFPEAFLERMKRLLGEEYEAFLESLRSGRAQGLRFNPLKGEPEQMAAENRERFGLRKIPWCREGWHYDGETRPGRHPYHEAGVYYIQEPSAMAVTELLDPQPGERVLDLCAAPGGKTTHIAGRMAGRGILVSNEIHPARAKILSQNVERMGITNAVVTNADAEKLAGYFPKFFDRIVVDAPCSGEGMFRKDEQARLQWSEENVRLCADRQQEILDRAAEMLKDGGRMVYSTCTFSPEEDEEGIARFLVRHPEFSLESVPGREGLSPGRPEWGGISCPELSRTFRIWPHKAEGEGHFLAVLRKAGELSAEDARRRKSPKYWQDKGGLRSLAEFAADTLVGGPLKDLPTKNVPFLLFGDQLYLVPEELPDVAGLKVLRPGLHLGTLKKNRFEPSHALALALQKEQAQKSRSLDGSGEELAAYLRGETLAAQPGERGWILICADRYSIGWAKAASGILKNHYPKGLRLP